MKISTRRRCRPKTACLPPAKGRVYPNPFHSDIPAKVIADVQAYLDAIKAVLAPYLISLTPKERKTMLRIADRTVAFVGVRVSNDLETQHFAPHR